MAGIKYLDGKVFVIGGEIWSTTPSKNAFILDLSTNSQTGTWTIPEFYYGGAISIFGTKIYMFGGGTLIGSTMRMSIPSYNMFIYDLLNFGPPCPIICSPGTYQVENTCIKCFAGSYSDDYKESACKLCPAGTFNSYSGANSIGECYPCGEGYYSTNPGSVICLQCPYSYFCPIGSITYSESNLTYSVTSNQPTNYSPDLETLNQDKTILYVLTSASFLILMIAMKYSPKFQLFLPKLDQYKVLHNYDLDKNLEMKKNKFGGLFSIIFFLVAILLIVSAILEYKINNIIETKALVPLVILENTVNPFNGTVEIIMTLYNYGDTCVKDSNTTEANLTFVNLDYDYVTYSGSMNDKNCVVKITCETCTVTTGSYIYFSFQQLYSYSTMIGINISAVSSIPNQYSKISETITSASGTVFRGYSATQFNMLMTPSVFSIDDSSHISTGYHISIDSNAVAGTESMISE